MANWRGASCKRFSCLMRGRKRAASPATGICAGKKSWACGSYQAWSNKTTNGKAEKFSIRPTARVIRARCGCKLPINSKCAAISARLRGRKFGNGLRIKTPHAHRGQATTKNKSARKDAETQSYRKVFSFAFLCGTLASRRASSLFDNEIFFVPSNEGFCTRFFIVLQAPR